MNDVIRLGQRNPASYRDPSGHVYVVEGRVFRTVRARARADYEHVRDSGLLDSLQQAGALVGTRELDRHMFADLDPDVTYVLEHDRIPWVSYPYEWTFAALKKAALLHLQIQIEALEHDVVLSDASAYNVQFIGPRPVFIDTLSFRKYQEGEYWTGHRQFCHQFLNPLVMAVEFGVRHNAWFRGSGEGIDAADLNCLLSLRHKLRWRTFTNITLQARLQQQSLDTTTADLSRLKTRRLPRRSYIGILQGLMSWIASMNPRQMGRSTWERYSRDNTYSDAEASLKHRAVQAFASTVRPELAWDMGCNTGEYSETLLSGGAGHVIGFDFDFNVLEQAFARSEQRELALQPLFQDAANASPSQGWRGQERARLEERGPVDAIVALAFEHHLAIGRNIPLNDVVDWLTSLAPQGIIEFVQKDDETIRRMLALREDIFAEYGESQFVASLERNCTVVERTPVSGSRRVLYQFRRR